MKYVDTVSIDESRLDREWAGQPARYQEMAEHCAAAETLVDQLKDQLDVIEAEEESRIRKEFDDLKEAQVKAKVILSPKVIVTKEKLVKAKNEMRLIQGAVKAMDHRKKALENLVQLHLSAYHSEPRNANAKQAVEKMRNDQIADNLRPRGSRRN
jgi:hypothetical protein